MNASSRLMAGALALATAGLAHAAAPASPGIVAPEAGTSAVPTVRVGDDFFSPRRVHVRRGGLVRFRWVGRDFHNVSGGGRTSRTTDRRGYVYPRRFRRTTRLICTEHPEDMRMTVRVR